MIFLFSGKYVINDININDDYQLSAIKKDSLENNDYDINNNFDLDKEIIL